MRFYRTVIHGGRKAGALSAVAAARADAGEIVAARETIDFTARRLTDLEVQGLTGAVELTFLGLRKSA